MKLALTFLSAVTLLGCSQDHGALPIDANNPDPPFEVNQLAWLWGMVVSESGVCIEGASVSVVGGQGLGQSATQRVPCDAWAYDGGFEFKNLTPGVAMTLRSLAPGYAAKEVTVVPYLGPQTAFLIVPSRLP